MWNRADIKNRGKALFKRNYWRCVATALLAGLLMTGFGSTAASYTGTGAFNGTQGQQDTQSSFSDYALEEGNRYFDEFYGYGDAAGAGGAEDADDIEDIEDIEDIIDEMTEGRQGLPGIINRLNGNDRAKGIAGLFAGAALGMFILFICIIAFAFMAVYTAFIANPVETGMQRFFISNEAGNAEVKKLAYAFDSNYMNIAKVMFFRTLYTFLWGLLFIIPGIVKSYEYRMIPYLLAENPDLTKEEAFGISREMMKGNKWKAFVFDLSFIGWFLLSALTAGVLGIFYVNPYYYQSCAFLYEAIKGEYTDARPQVGQDYI